MKIAIILTLIAVWAYVLHVMRRANLKAWHFFCGSFGIFIWMMLLLRPYVTQPLACGVSFLAGIIGKLTGTFSAYFKYGIIFISTATESLTLKIDFECSGVIEIMAFLSLLIFFEVYNRREKIVVGIFGFVYIMLCNTLRVLMICLSVHFLGIEAYHTVHTYVARIFFYVLSVLLYFYVFTKPQIVKTKVGSFKYGNSESNS